MMAGPNQTFMITDLGYGDAGKGSIVDYLTRACQAHTVVRFNGGAQAAHNVITPDGRHHTFAQFGSGTFIPGVKTHLSRFMILHPLAMLSEERHLRSLGIPDAFQRVSIDRRTLVITPFQQSANRIKEIARGDGRHGSCGLGVGETVSDWLSYDSDVLFAGDLDCREQVVRKLKFIRDLKIGQVEMFLRDQPTSQSGDQGRGSVRVARKVQRAIQEEIKILRDPQVIDLTADLFTRFIGLVRLVEPEYLGKILNRSGVTIFEGAQGVLLDEWYGFYPYNSWSTLTFKNADTLLSENNFTGDRFKLGLIRGYATRHGTGPFVSEDVQLTATIQDHHNQDNPWQRRFRVGYLDLVALRYALKVAGPVDGLTITNLDRMEAIPDWKICSAYRYPGIETDLEGYFEHQGGLVTDILVPPDPTNLARQETLTRLLMQMRPVYTPCEHHQETYLSQIGQALQLPIALTSTGPTARDKKSTLFQQFSSVLQPISNISTERSRTIYHSPNLLHPFP